FGILGISTSGGTCQTFLDDVTFSSYNVAQPPPPSTPEWKINNSGDWLLDTNWTGNVAPNAVGAEAKLGSIITSGQLVYANSNITLGKLTFDNTNSYLVAGLGTMTLQVSTGSASVTVTQGSHKLNLPIVVASNTNLIVAAGSTLR